MPFDLLNGAASALVDSNGGAQFEQQLDRRHGRGRDRGSAQDQCSAGDALVRGVLNEEVDYIVSEWFFPEFAPCLF